MLERPGRNKAYFNTGGMVKIRFLPPRPNSELYAFFRPGQSMVNFFVSGGQSTPITLFYALDGHRIWNTLKNYYQGKLQSAYIDHGDENGNDDLCSLRKRGEAWQVIRS